MMKMEVDANKEAERDIATQILTSPMRISRSNHTAHPEHAIIMGDRRDASAAWAVTMVGGQGKDMTLPKQDHEHALYNRE